MSDEPKALTRDELCVLANEFEQMLRDHRKAPEWKRVAIQRALAQARK